MRRSRHFFCPLASLVALSAVLLLGCPNPAGPPSGPDDPVDPPESGVAAQPVFSPAAGTYTGTVSVTISCATGGTQIRYTTDGSLPGETSTLYSGAIPVNANTTLRAIATGTGLMSAFGSAVYKIVGTVATPHITPATGSYTSVQTVTITCATPGAAIHYTTDASTPTEEDPIYSGPFTVSATAGVRAVAMKVDWVNSAMASSTITINLPADKAAPPTIAPEGGLYFEDQTVTLAAAGAEQIWYTKDGSDPTTSGTRFLYAGAITVSTTDTQIRAYAVDTDMTDQSSDIVSAAYRLKVATPTVSPDPAAGPVLRDTEFTLSCSTPGALIYYNLDGEDPGDGDGTYSAGDVLYAPRLRAVGTKADYEDSDWLVADFGFISGYAYTDGAGHVYQLVYNGADVDITGHFEHTSGAMSFATVGSSDAPQCYYLSGGHVYSFEAAGADVEVTAGLEEFDSATSRIFWLYDGLLDEASLTYRTDGRLWAYDPAGPDADITPPHFSAASEVLYVLFTDGAGEVYEYDLASPTVLTELFENYAAGSHLCWLDNLQTFDLPIGYSAAGKVYVVDEWGPDHQFDPSHYEHLASGSAIFILQ